MTLQEYANAYRLAHDIEPATVQYLDHAIRALDRWHGRETTLADLCDDLLNGWITDRIAAGKSRKTVRTQRGAILTLWRAAADDGLTAIEPRRVKIVKSPTVNPDAYWPDQVAKLLRAAESAPGRFPCGARRADLLTAWLLTRYYTLLRECDARRLLKTDIRSDGGLMLTQAKTKYTVARYLPPDAMAALAAVFANTDTPVAFPIGKKTMCRWWKWLKKTANVAPGSPKWLRRTGATQCEIIQPGSAMLALGHKTPGLAYKHYVDRRQLQEKPVVPPTIKG